MFYFGIDVAKSKLDCGDQAEAETETLSFVPIPLAQDAERFVFSENMFNHNTFPR